MPLHQEIRAQFDQNTITVYQAYPPKIAKLAVQHQQFVPPFSFQRMTWIKPSFLWLMARSNWGQKSNQEHTLAVQLQRVSWEEALAEGVLTHPDKNIYSSGAAWQTAFDQARIHIQWDPERSLRGAKLPHRTIQVGISRQLIEAYNEEWITKIEDCTPLVKKIHHLRKMGNIKAAKRLLPLEKLYPVSSSIAHSIGIG